MESQDAHRDVDQIDRPSGPPRLPNRKRVTVQSARLKQIAFNLFLQMFVFVWRSARDELAQRPKLSTGQGTREDGGRGTPKQNA